MNALRSVAAFPVRVVAVAIGVTAFCAFAFCAGFAMLASAVEGE